MLRFETLPFFDLFSPPTPFAKDIEDEFQSDYAKRFAKDRRASAIFGVVTWTLFIAWDIFHGTQNKAFAYTLVDIIFLRVIGIIVLLVLAVKTNPHFLENEQRATKLLSGFVFVAYGLLLAMMYVVPFPYDYLYYFIGLFFVLTFLFGLFRLRVRPALGVGIICVAVSFITFKIKTPTALPLIDLVRTANYYVWSAVSDLLAFLLVGYVVANELEKTSRKVFMHERELDDAHKIQKENHRRLANLNSSLIKSKNDLDLKTKALMRIEEERRKLAERENQEKSYFIACAIHDVTEPATAILMLIRSAIVALEARDSELARANLFRIEEAGRRMNNLFNAVLDLSRIESGLSAPGYASIDVNKIVSEVVTSLRVKADACGVRLRYNEINEAGLAVYSSQEFLQRVLFNLIKNAIKYRDRSKVRPLWVDISITSYSDLVRIYVTDNGIGIPKGLQNKIYDPFFQRKNPSVVDNDAGMGLGLSLAHAMVSRLNDHKLGFFSVEKRGTRFFLQLPRCETLLLRPSSLVEQNLPSAQFCGKFVLVVYEGGVTQEAIKASLTDFGIIVECASTMGSFRDLLSKLEMAPDAIIAEDQIDRQGNWVEIISETRRTMANELPVIILTDNRSKFIASAVPNVRIMRKPFLPEALYDELALIFRSDAARSVRE